MPSPLEPSSARRRRRRAEVVPLAAAAVLLATIVAVRLGARPEPSAEGVPPTARYHGATATPSPALTPTPTPTPTPPASAPQLIATDWVSVPAATPAPLPPAVPTPTPLPRRPAAEPTPGPSLCVTYTASGTTSLAAWGQVLVEIEAHNGCDRDLGPLEVWFEVQGWREGALVQTARGHLFSELRRGRYERTTIALPGSASWYDRIVVLPLDP